MTGTARLLLSVLLLTAAGCKRNDLNGVGGGLRFDPTSVQFDSAFADGVARTRDVSVVNDGPATVDVAWKGLTRPFAADLPARLQPGATTVTLSWTPEVPGHFSQLLEVQSAGLTTATLPIEATSNPIPSCVATSPCVTSSFNLATLKCVEVPVTDGADCDPGTKCLVEARCEAGRCVGTARTCEDHNRCTEAYPVRSLRGCAHHQRRRPHHPVRRMVLGEPG